MQQKQVSNFWKSNSHLLLKSDIRKLKTRIQKIISFAHSTRVRKTRGKKDHKYNSVYICNMYIGILTFV